MTLSVGRASYQNFVDLLDAILPLSKRPGCFREEQMVLKAPLPAAYSMYWN